MKLYGDFKECKVIWFKRLPPHWHHGQLKFWLISNEGGLWGEDYSKNSKKGTIVLRSTEITIDGKWHIDNPAIRTLTDKEKEKAILKTGDLLITKSSGSEAHIGKTALVTQDIENLSPCFSNFMQRIRPGEGLSSRFLYYFLNSFISREQFNYFSTTTSGLANLNSEVIGSLRLTYPPLPEQQSIADFLDRKIAQLDTLISKKQRLITLLQEYRTALINQTVTKGLDPNVAMKDSGYEWLGEIPEHWEVLNLKFVTKFNYGNSLSQDNRKTGNVPVFGSNGIIGYHNEAITKSPCIVIGRKGSYGKVNFCKSKCFPIDTTYFIDETSTIYNLKWVYYLLLSLNLDSYSRDSAVPGLNREEAYQKRVILPPLDEQTKVAGFLDNFCKKTELAIQKIKHQLQILEEYRMSLISEAVTGKIDVRDWKEEEDGIQAGRS